MNFKNIEWYRTGGFTGLGWPVRLERVKINNGATIVKGTATEWLIGEIKAGDIFTTDGSQFYEIASVTGSSELVLKTQFQGESCDGQAYAIISRTAAVMQAEIAVRLETVLDKLEKCGLVTFEITIPATGWVKILDDTTGYPYQIDIQNEIIDDTMFPQLITLPEYDEIVKKAKIYSKVETINVALKIKAKAIPESEIKAQLTLQGVALSISGGGKVIPSGDVEAGDCLAWSSDGKLAVKIGSGLKFNEDRAVAADTQTVITDDDMLDEDETEQDLKEILLG